MVKNALMLVTWKIISDKGENTYNFVFQFSICQKSPQRPLFGEEITSFVFLVGKRKKDHMILFWSYPWKGQMIIKKAVKPVIPTLANLIVRIWSYSLTKPRKKLLSGKLDPFFLPKKKLATLSCQIPKYLLSRKGHQGLVMDRRPTGLPFSHGQGREMVLHCICQSWAIFFID